MKRVLLISLTHFITIAVMSFLLGCITQVSAAEDPVASLDTAAMLERSVLSTGNQARLQCVMAKARRGEPITVGVIGGSITQGALAGKPHQRYGNLTVAVDGGEPLRFESDKHSPHASVPGQRRVAENLAPGPHEVVLTVGEKTPAIATTRCTVFAIGVTVPTKDQEKQ